MNKKQLKQYISENIVDADISYRGGTLKVDVSKLFNTGDEEAVMGAYQNYLGGGIAGSIQSGRQFDISHFSKKDLKLYNDLAEAIKKYFYDINNGGGDDYMQENITGKDAKDGYENLKSMPRSAY